MYIKIGLGVSTTLCGSLYLCSRSHSFRSYCLQIVFGNLLGLTLVCE